MDLQRQLDTLEAEIHKLRKRVRNSEYQDQLTLDAPLIAQSIAGEEREIVKGYDGPLYDIKVDALSGLAAADDSFTLISSQVNDTTDVSALTLKATRLSGALIYDCKVQIYNSGDGSSPNTKIVLSPLNDWTLTAYELAMPASSHIAMGTAASDPSSPADGWLFYRTDTDRARLRANGAWVNLATTDDLSGYTRVYYKANNGTSGTGPAATTSETSLGSFTITGGDMGTTGIMRVRMMGTSSGAGATRTVRIRVKLGGVTIYDDTTVTYATTVPWYMELHIANVGNAAIQRTGGFFLIGAPTATTGSGDIGTDEIISTTPIYASSTINTASNQTFEVTAQLSSGTSPNSFINLSTVAELL